MLLSLHTHGWNVAIPRLLTNTCTALSLYYAWLSRETLSLFLPKAGKLDHASSPGEARIRLSESPSIQVFKDLMIQQGY